MVILDRRIHRDELIDIEDECFFEDMIKCVVDIDEERVALNAELHSDLEEMLLEAGSEQKSLYGINIMFDIWEIEFDSLINPPRNRAAGFPRAGRYVADPDVRKKITEVIEKWIEI